MNTEHEECQICSDFGTVTPASYELKYCRDTAEERGYAELLCAECFAQMTLGAEDLYQAEDYVII